MIAVIQCASKKRPGAGHMTLTNGKPVIFVAHPETAPADAAHTYARPDDFSDTGISWRDLLLKYNENPKGNPLRLSPAYKLYSNEIYERLVDRLGSHNVYILSAGWGLIRADFLTPYYDVTFRSTKEAYKQRKKKERYRDFCLLPEQTNEEIVFFGGKEYLPLFCSLTAKMRSEKTVFYNSLQQPQVTGCALKLFETTTRTNWHYECVKAFLNGKIDLEN